MRKKAGSRKSLKQRILYMLEEAANGLRNYYKLQFRVWR